MKNKKTKESSANYLELIPVHNNKYDYVMDEQGRVTILKENTGLMNLVFQKLMGKPRVSQIHLDEMGNFVWPLIDGKRDLMAISELVKEEFGPKAEPLYERLAKYMKILESYGFIELT